MKAALRSGFVMLALLGAAPAFGQSSLGGAGSLPPPQRPGSAPAPTTAAPPPARPAPPPAATPPARQAAPTPAAPRRPAAQRPATPRPPAARRTTPPAATTTAPEVRPPSRPNARPPAATATRPAPPSAARRAGAGAAAGAAAGAGAAAAAARPPEPAAPPAVQEPSIGTVTNLPLPRFAALRSDEVNLRAGPGTRFPIEWTYQRRELPVEITREFELWRRIRDPEGTEGWVHQSTLMGRRSVIVRGAPGSEILLRREPQEGAPAAARLRPGVVLRLRQCEPRNPWCEAQVGDHRGYILRRDIWGVNAEEEVK